MNGIHIDNIDVDSMRRPVNKGLYKLKKALMTGLLAASIVPTITGCGKGDEISYKTSDGYVYFDEKHRERDTVYFNSEMTNTAIEELKDFGDHVTTIYLSYCLSIDDLSKIAEYCPNLEKIYIYYCPSIADLDFIYSLPNLKEVDIFESGFITPELIKYLDENGIKHNLTQQDLDNAAELDRIISEIITDDMTDEEKIQAITYYVISNYHYRITKGKESNEEPLTSTFRNKGGVCASYAYLTNILLRKAGIKSYEVISENVRIQHAWNIVEIDGKYYYLDTTNIKQIPFISKLLLKYLNIGLYYMTDPRATGMSAMHDFDNIQKVTIPEEMIEDIERGESEKTIFEKYGNSVPARIIEFVLICTALTMGISLTTKGIGAVRDTLYYRKRRKQRLEQKRREAKKREKEAKDILKEEGGFYY